MAGGDPFKDKTLMMDFVGQPKQDMFQTHWTDTYAQVMAGFLEMHYGTRAKVGAKTGISASMMSQMLSGNKYHVSTETLSRLEAACMEIIERKHRVKNKR